MSQVVKLKPGGFHLQYANPGSLAADREAEQDVKDYVTAKQWGYLTEIIQSGVPFGRIYFLLGMVGVRGYPVAALIHLHHPRYLSRFSQRRV
jgi:hypothetical protein